MVSYQDLVPLPRLLPALQKQVRVSAPGGLDVKRLLSASAKRQWPARLPRTQRPNWPQHLLLLVDCRVELYPYRNDFFRLASALKALVPASQISIYVGETGPDGLWESWSTQQIAGRTVVEGLPKPCGATYLVLSDLGLLCAKPGMQQQWLRALQVMAPAAHSLFALAPVEAHQVPLALAELVQVLRWSPSSRFTPERGTQEMVGLSEQERDEARALGQLVTCVGAVLRMDPPLLRAMRQASHWPSHAGLEGLVWAHARVSGTTYASLKGGVAQGVVRPLSPAMVDVLRKASETHHAHWTLGMRLVDNMRLLSANPSGDEALLASTRRAITQLTMASWPGAAVAADARHTASYVLARVPEQARPMLGDVLSDLAESQGIEHAERVPWSLVQIGERLMVTRWQEKREGPGTVLADFLGLAAVGEPLMLREQGQAAQLLELPRMDGVALPPTRSSKQLILGGVRTDVFSTRRTRGIRDWGQVRFLEVDQKQQSLHGLIGHVELPWPGGKERVECRLNGRGGHRLFDGLLEKFEALLAFDEFGVAFGLRLKALATVGANHSDLLRFRFRYLLPATFLMGSPEGVGDDDEHPQHPVTITQGLWLAETPCTQCLWQAVMGHNPSHFNKGPDVLQRPVENVSWDDVQQFLAKLNTLLPEGCEAVLPTEAQWEYACRAGTSTAYWWGDEPDDSKANWKNQQQGTTPVDRYPPNPWGLRDMHGNVWEWCADGEQRTYEQRTARDPMSDTGGDARVVRGGSWFDPPGYARSACHDGGQRGDRYHGLGFRFALRSSSPQGAEPQPRGLKAADGQEKGGADGGRSAGAGASAPATRAPTKKKGPT